MMVSVLTGLEGPEGPGPDHHVRSSIRGLKRSQARPPPQPRAGPGLAAELREVPGREAGTSGWQQLDAEVGRAICRPMASSFKVATGYQSVYIHGVPTAQVHSVVRAHEGEERPVLAAVNLTGYDRHALLQRSLCKPELAHMHMQQTAQIYTPAIPATLCAS